MKAEMGVKMAKAFVKALENTNDMALIFFEEGGLRCRLMDANGYRLLEINVPSESMISYDFSESNSVEFGVVVSHLKDMTKGMTVKEKDTLLIEYDLEDPTWLNLTSCGVKRRLRLLKSTMMKRHKKPEIESKWSSRIPFKNMKSFFTTIGKTEVFDLTVDSESLCLKAETDDGVMEMDIPTESLHVEGGPFVILLGNENFVSAVSTTDAKSVLDVRGGDDSTPLEVHWSLDGVSQRVWVATRSRR